MCLDVGLLQLAQGWDCGPASGCACLDEGLFRVQQARAAWLEVSLAAELLNSAKDLDEMFHVESLLGEVLRITIGL